jgi:hypothetical protein
MWNSINRSWFQQVWWLKSSMICPLAFPSCSACPVQNDTERRGPALWVPSSGTTPTDVSVVLLSYQCAPALPLQYTMFPRDACRIRIASSVVSLTVSSTASRQSALRLRGWVDLKAIHSAAGRTRSIEKSNDLIRNQTRDLPACSMRSWLRWSRKTILLQNLRTEAPEMAWTTDAGSCDGRQHRAVISSSNRAPWILYRTEQTLLDSVVEIMLSVI